MSFQQHKILHFSFSLFAGKFLNWREVGIRYNIQLDIEDSVTIRGLTSPNYLSKQYKIQHFNVGLFCAKHLNLSIDGVYCNIKFNMINIFTFNVFWFNDFKVTTKAKNIDSCWFSLLKINVFLNFSCLFYLIKLELNLLE